MKANILPVSLPEAIEALKSDRILIEALGEKFMELFFKIKEIELKSLGNTADVNDESVFAREREIYMKLIWVHDVEIKFGIQYFKLVEFRMSEKRRNNASEHVMITNT